MKLVVAETAEMCQTERYLLLSGLYAEPGTKREKVIRPGPSDMITLTYWNGGGFATPTCWPSQSRRHGLLSLSLGPGPTLRPPVSPIWLEQSLHDSEASGHWGENQFRQERVHRRSHVLLSRRVQSPTMASPPGNPQWAWCLFFIRKATATSTAFSAGPLDT